MKISKGLIISIFVLLSGNPLYSQPPPAAVERATSGIDELQREREERIRERGAQPREKPAVVEPEEAPVSPEEEKFFVKKINLAGMQSFSPEDFASIVQKYENREVGLSELEVLSKEIEREYLRRGVIAAVFVVPQEIAEGTVTLQVVEAKMGELQAQDARYFSKKRLYYYWKILPGEVLRYDKISRSIQMMNKNPDREVKAALHAGKKPGTTDIYLTPETSLPAHLTYTFDHEGVVSTGKTRQGYGARMNNFLGLDDTLMGGYNSGRAFNGFYLYHSLPVTPYGTTLLYGYSRSVSIPGKEFSVFGIESNAKNSSVSLHQDLYKKDEYIGEIYVGFDAKDKVTWIASGEPVYNKDRLRIFTLGGSYVRRDFGATTTISPEIARGVKAFGASKMYNPFASRGAHPDFTKATLGIQHRRSLPLGLQANIKVKGQWASEKLTPQEEFSLGGIDSVRGYPAGDYLADSAVTDSVELLIPAFFVPSSWHLPYAEKSLKDQTTGVLFVDYGWGQRRGPLESETSGRERSRVNMLAAGAGLRFSLYNQALVRLEWGFPLAANRPITEAGRSRFHISVDFQERLPEEIERITKLNEEENIKQWAKRLLDEELIRPGSAVRKKLYGYMDEARACEQKNQLKECKAYYEKIDSIGKSLLQQAEEYARACLTQQKELKTKEKLAKKFEQEGRTEDAKKLWQQISDGAIPKPFILEF
ncbi:MAG: ShlB/FhaC/HecB family hemolysin secretion/activation protein [Candidatus Omnitrophica bacterium]|nr:ShlB/FhaC/HecB family hemolysin secretion/activation protein [Candidatus Omnitrophota bacterium]